MYLSLGVSKILLIMAGAVFLPLVIVSVFFTSCVIGDGAIGVEGRTYEWVNAPENAVSQYYYKNDDPLITSTVQAIEIMTSNLPPDMTLIPMANVTISVDEKNHNVFSLTSNSKGEFNAFKMAAGGIHTLSILISKSGYKTLSKIVEPKGAKPVMIMAILVKEKGQ
jgi:hypothetical protein